MIDSRFEKLPRCSTPHCRLKSVISIGEQTCKTHARATVHRLGATAQTSSRSIQMLTQFAMAQSKSRGGSQGFTRFESACSNWLQSCTSSRKEKMLWNSH